MDSNEGRKPDKVELKPNVILPFEDAQALFDMVCNSMDFGSGFLETNDVNVLRKVAVAIGVDPMVATPSEFKTQYRHTFVKRTEDTITYKNMKWGLDDLERRHKESFKDFGTVGSPVTFKALELQRLRIEKWLSECHVCQQLEDHRVHNLKGHNGSSHLKSYRDEGPC